MTPTSIKIGPFVYTVSTDEAGLRRQEHAAKGACSGATSHPKLEIHIDPNDAPGQQRDTLWHEVKHAILNISGFDGKATEEEFIQRTSALELAALRDNPELVAYLTDDA